MLLYMVKRTPSEIVEKQPHCINPEDIKELSASQQN